MEMDTSVYSYEYIILLLYTEVLVLAYYCCNIDEYTYELAGCMSSGLLVWNTFSV